MKIPIVLPYINYYEHRPIFISSQQSDLAVVFHVNQIIFDVRTVIDFLSNKQRIPIGFEP